MLCFLDRTESNIWGDGHMVIAELKIRCWNCGREEEVVERFQDDIVDFNLDKPCPACSDSWMTKKELTMKRTVNEEMWNKYHSVVRGG